MASSPNSAHSSKENEADEEMKPYVTPLGVGAGHLQQATMWLMQNGMANPTMLARRHRLLHLFGLMSFALMWAKMAKAALAEGCGRRSLLRRQACHSALFL